LLCDEGATSSALLPPGRFSHPTGEREREKTGDIPTTTTTTIGNNRIVAGRLIIEFVLKYLRKKNSAMNRRENEKGGWTFISPFSLSVGLRIICGISFNVSNDKMWRNKQIRKKKGNFCGLEE
jgi:hypothetical protein